MALIPPFFLDAVVALGVGNDPNLRKWIGTGFLYGLFVKDNDDGTKAYTTFLVTNNHVLEGIERLWVKFNSLSGVATQDFDIPLKAKNGREIDW